MARASRREIEERIHQVGLLSRRKSPKFIVHFIAEKWGLKDRQIRNYIRLAEKEWEKYFSRLKRCGKSYHAAQLRDLKDAAYSKKIVIGKGEKRINEKTGKLEIVYDDKQVITIADLNLILEIIKEEAKLMGIYPTSKIEGDLNLKHSGEIDSRLTHILKMEDEELDGIIKKLSKTGINNSHSGEEKKRD
ncbi:hypothetical protein ES705_38071 [subsurface metagenome]